MDIGIYNPAVGTRYSGGTETFLREMSWRLARDHHVTVYTGSGDLIPELRDSAVDCVQLPYVDKSSRIGSLARRVTAGQLLPGEAESISLFAGSRFGKVIDSRGHDVVSTHYYLDNMFISRTLNVPTLFRFPGVRSPSPRWKAMARFADPDVYVSNSEMTADRVREWLDIDVQGTVYAGVDIERFSPDTSPTLRTDGVTVLYVGRLEEGKGLFDLLEAFSNLDEPDATLLLVGDGVSRSRLRKRARQIGISDMVRFEGEIEHNDIHEYYAAADIFCLPSEHEGFGIVNVEAMASGLPVISTRIPAVEEVVDHEETGLLFDVGDVEELTDIFKRLIGDKALRERLGKAARRKAVKEFTWDAQAERMEVMYELACA